MLEDDQEISRYAQVSSEVLSETMRELSRAGNRVRDMKGSTIKWRMGCLSLI